MLAIAPRRVPEGTVVAGDALALPFADDSFDRVFTAHFYGHLESRARAFLAETRRVAPELVVVERGATPNHRPEEWQRRTINDGSRFAVTSATSRPPSWPRSSAEDRHASWSIPRHGREAPGAPPPSLRHGPDAAVSAPPGSGGPRRRGP